MNDFFIRSMIRQRHEQILVEVRAARIPQQEHQRTTRKMKNGFRMFLSFFMQWKRSMVCSRPALDERKSI